jgi:hypothetical protein
MERHLARLEAVAARLQAGAQCLIGQELTDAGGVGLEGDLAGLDLAPP